MASRKPRDASEAATAPTPQGTAPDAPAPVQAAPTGLPHEVPLTSPGSSLVSAEPGQLGPEPLEPRDHDLALSPQVTPPLAVDSRARAMALLVGDLEGSDEQPPLPLTTACKLRGIPVRTVEDRIARGAAPELERARARGLARCLRGAMAGGDNGRQWAWLAERLAPKELHLPTRVPGVAAEDGGAPIGTELRVTLDLARSAARDDYDGPLALPKPR